ncbi:PP2C family protein-serine/threonine phosphatase [Streptomyces sp. NPDC051976]|uniref:PP2C family protein-serine/threonine phosphatase n=1 Tax=Streptomyces sp. NPDC051976 TaxID=3154947 RepID=UPI0034195953
MAGQDHDGGLRRMLAGLASASHLMSLRAMPREVRTHAAAAGIDDVQIYLTDLQESVLRLMTGEGLDARGDADAGDAELKIDGTMAGRAFQNGQLIAFPGEAEAGVAWWVPLLDGTERLGVLRAATAADDEETRGNLELLSSLVALMVVSKRSSSDAHARLVRTDAMNVAAEMQWHLMPPRTYADDRVVVGAAMEPAYQVGGDAFDYALADDVLHMAVFDAMGHDTSAGVTANLAVATSRNRRRQGFGLAETSVAIELALEHEFHRARYVTGILADLNTRTGALSWVNRGHHPPLVIRGGRWTTHLTCPPAHPMGTNLGLEPTLCHEQLEPGDRLVLYTDGITEARNPGGLEFGLDGFVDFLLRHHASGLPVPETLRRLIHSILDHHHGQLADDATVLLVQWLGATDHSRHVAEHLAGMPSQHPAEQAADPPS